MKRIVLLFAMAAVLAASCKQTSYPVIPQDKEIEKKISQVLSQMTLEEKIGQMTQVTATILVDGKQELTPEGEAALRKYKVGSVLNPPVRVGTPPADIDKNPVLPAAPHCAAAPADDDPAVHHRILPGASR